MKRTGRKQEWSLTLFAFGVLAFLPPLVGVYDRAFLVLGIPLSYLIIFCIWGFIIFATWLGSRPSTLHQDTPPNGETNSLEPTFDETDTPLGRR